MDYQFKKDIYGQPIAKFSMGHEAVGQWFTDELNSNQSIDGLLFLIEQIEQGTLHRKTLQGQMLELSISPLEVEISALTDESVFDDMPEETDRYDDESYSQCGLQDFKNALVSWREYNKS